MNPPEIDDLLRPFSARSLIASALLGSHPPRLPGRLLVAMAERFGIAAGTARVALSRMVEREELVNDDGVYALAGDLLERQERQDRSRVPVDAEWDGSWEQAVVVATGRSAADRGALRKQLSGLGLGERREGVWMRPANLDPARQPATRAAIDGSVEWYVLEPLDHAAATGLAGELFDLEGWATRAGRLTTALDETRRRLAEDPDAVVTGFMLASAALRHLANDAQLPTLIEPDAWPSDALRRSYAAFEAEYQSLLRAFFRSLS